MYLITRAHTVAYSICILWGEFVGADGSVLSAMRTKAVLEIKTGSSDFRICNCSSLSHSHSSSLLFGLLVLIQLFPDKQVVKMLHVFFLHHLDAFYPLHSFFLITLSVSPLLFSSYLPLLLRAAPSKLSHTVTCTCQSCIVRIQHIPLAWQTWFTWSRCSLTADERGLNNSPFSPYWPTHSQSSAVQPNVYITVKSTVEHRLWQVYTNNAGSLGTGRKTKVLI